MTLKKRIIGIVFIFVVLAGAFVWFSLQQEAMVVDEAAQQQILSERERLDTEIPKLLEEIADIRKKLGLKTANKK